MTGRLEAIIDHLRMTGLLCGPYAVTALPGGRTNAVWKVTTETESIVIKLYQDLSDNPLFPNDPASELICLRALSGRGLVPDLIAADVDTTPPWICYRHIDGRPWLNTVEPVAQGLLGIHKSAAPKGLRRLPSGSRAVARQTQAILSRCSGAEADRLLGEMPEVLHVPAGDVGLIHGDPVPGNILETDRGLRFIDWQCPAIGDPCEDIALFLSPAMQLLYRGAILDRTEERAFLTAYAAPDVTQRVQMLRPWFHWRMAAYCLWRVQAGAHEYADGLEAERAALSTLMVTRRHRSFSQKPA